MAKNRYGAVILAAGYSSRMGAFKPILKIGDESVVSRLQRIFKANGIEKITVVGGFNIDLLKDEISEGSRLVLNDRYDRGMFTSIQKGVRTHIDDEEIDGVFLTPVDYPLVAEATIEILMANLEGEHFAVPLYMGKKGHPLYIPRKYFDEIISHDGTNGLKGITDKYRGEIKRVETGDIGCVMDMDTPEDYERLQEFHKSYIGKGRCFDAMGALESKAAGRTFYLVRHGEPVQHERGKIFLGRTDVPLSEKGKKQALAIKDKKGSPGRVYASPLKRAYETAEIAYPESVIIKAEDFKEMNLGPWDGRYIEDVKKENPELFEERGRNLFTFKLGNKGENFYDLQYRVMMQLLDILENDDSEEIHIVAHSGVIRCIENLLNGKTVDEPWERPANGEIRIVRK